MIGKRQLRRVDQPFAKHDECDGVFARAPRVFHGQSVFCVVVRDQPTLEAPAQPTDLRLRTKRLISVKLTETSHDAAMAFGDGHILLDEHRKRGMIHGVIRCVRDDFRQLDFNARLNGGQQAPCPTQVLPSSFLQRGTPSERIAFSRVVSSSKRRDGIGIGCTYCPVS